MNFGSDCTRYGIVNQSFKTQKARIGLTGEVWTGGTKWFPLSEWFTFSVNPSSESQSEKDDGQSPKVDSLGWANPLPNIMVIRGAVCKFLGEG